MSATATAFKPKRTSHRPQQWSTITLLANVSSWAFECMAKISEFAQLPQNWDSYGSNPVTPDALRMARKFLSESPLALIPEPSVSPVSGGGLGFHWRVETRDLEIEFLPDGSVEYIKTVRTPEGSKSDEGIVDNFSDKKIWYWLAGELT